jgi:hypothetical protein
MKHCGAFAISADADEPGPAMDNAHAASSRLGFFLS